MKIRGLPDDALVELYRSVAEQQSAVDGNDHKIWNKLDKQIGQIINELRSRGQLLALKPLLKNQNPCVRLQAASGIWQVARAEAKAVFDEIRAGPKGTWRAMASLLSE